MRKNDGISIVYHQFSASVFSANTATLDFPGGILDKTTHGYPDPEIRLIIFFAAKNGGALYIQQKQDWKLTVAQIMNSLLPNSVLN